MCVELTKNPFHIEHTFGRAAPIQWGQGAKPSCIRVEKTTSCEDQWKGLNPANPASSSVTQSKLYEISECGLYLASGVESLTGLFWGFSRTVPTYHDTDWWGRLSMNLLINIIHVIISRNNLFQIMSDCLPLTLTYPWSVIPQIHHWLAEQPSYWWFFLKHILTTSRRQQKKHPAGGKQVSENKPVLI